MKKRFFSKKLTALLLIATLTVTCFMLNSCGGSNDMAGDNKGEADYLQNSSSSGASSEIVPDNIDPSLKMIYTVNISAESKEFDKAVSTLQANATAAGGYLQSSNIQNNYSKRATLVFRIPSEKLNSFVASIGDACNITSQSSNADNVTEKYIDLEARLSTLKTQEERLLNMLLSAKDLQYLIELEDKLSDVRYEIEKYTASMRTLESQIAYSTVTMTLNEVVTYTEPEPENYFSRLFSAMGDGFGEFVEVLADFSIGIAYMLPWLVIIGVITAIVVIFTKRSNKKYREQHKDDPKTEHIHDPSKYDKK